MKTGTKKRKLLLPIKDLKPGKNNFAFVIKPSETDIEPKEWEIISPITTEVMVNRVNHRFFVSGKLRFTAKLLCANCAETYQKEISENYQSEYCSAGVYPRQNTVGDKPQRYKGKEQLTEETLDRVYIKTTDEYLDLTPLIYDTILLSIPIAPLCSEDCKGICPECGANLNRETCTCKS